MRKLWLGWLMLAAATAFGFWAYPQLPERVITHWGMSGQPDGWSSRAFAVVLFPGVMVLVGGILLIAPRIDPKRANFVMHSSAYWLVANLLMAFMAMVQVVMLGANLGWPIDLPRWIGGGVGLLFMVIGNLFTRVRPNWIFGIRTPWTLSSEASWRETHRYGGYGFVISGSLVVLTSFLFPAALFPVLVASILATSLFSVVWSYVVWKRDPTSGGSS